MGGRLREQRDFMRVPFVTNVEVRTDSVVYESAEVIDISMRGLSFSPEGPGLERGSTCTVVIRLAGGDEPAVIEAKAAVVRSGEGLAAVEFTELDLESYSHLQQLVVNNARDPEQAEREFREHWGILRPRK
jgi:hypothetical protein